MIRHSQRRCFCLETQHAPSREWSRGLDGDLAENLYAQGESALHYACSLLVWPIEVHLGRLRHPLKPTLAAEEHKQTARNSQTAPAHKVLSGLAGEQVNKATASAKVVPSEAIASSRMCLSSWQRGREVAWSNLLLRGAGPFSSSGRSIVPGCPILTWSAMSGFGYT